MRTFSQKQDQHQAHRNAPVKLPPKLALNAPGGTYEQEADRAADRITQMSEPIRHGACACGGGCPRCRNENDTNARLQTKRVQANDSREIVVPPTVREVLNSSGQPLDAAARGFMEPRFGLDFSQVRIHTDAQADKSAREVNAIAYTVGSNVVFGQGRYDPDSVEGRRLLAHELTHVVQQRGGESRIMRQAAGSEPEEDLHDGEGEGFLPHQCDDDKALDEAYDEWIHYDPEKDAEETTLINRINKEIFGPINRERNKIAADSFENTEAKKRAFPTGVLEAGASEERRKLFDSLSYTWLHSDTDEDQDRRQMIGVTQPMGDLSATNKVTGRVFGESSRMGTIWDYRGDNARAAGSELDTTGDFSNGIEAEDSISGYAEFKDSKAQRVLVPQLGFPGKPAIDTRQIMCGYAPVVKPGRAKRVGGPAGQKVTGAGDILRGGKHFFGKGTDPSATGQHEVFGQRSGPDKPTYWYFHQFPEDEDKQQKMEEIMQKKVDAITDKKSESYERLKQYYQARTAFIAKYRASLK